MIIIINISVRMVFFFSNFFTFWEPVKSLNVLILILWK